MSANDISADDAGFLADAAALGHSAEKIASLDTPALLRLSIEDLFAGKIALVSSFGADSAVLLHMVAQIDKALPVLFLDTGVLFPETLAYRDRLIKFLDLRNVISIPPKKDRLATEDPETFLWSSNPDRCCAIRKVLPLAEALKGFDAWITGRKRFQSSTRRSLPLFEAEEKRIKINPLANWSAAQILGYLHAHDLPRHELVAKGYPSIGCVPCTSRVRPGEDPRAGRWRGAAKVECGLHTQPLTGVALQAAALAEEPLS
ncbi:Phosphoadenosine phosphosulfate reductase [Methylocella tundrae]|uniref:Adenosine 5'-phosphosulfate reductase n=1 Tax=Methylocella tundrae TaxID=227605 RepID=A0A8B6M817_METTU|nr:phosphoadenylyl-sulfate reductase [Methylocella tundrae]VTZ50937.1 Phosphoadenosine phosphosulfate reductase [Methylocella tundrae]